MMTWGTECSFLKDVNVPFPLVVRGPGPRGEAYMGFAANGCSDPPLVDDNRKDYPVGVADSRLTDGAEVLYLYGEYCT